ncbi:MAG: FG-GAP repeat protein [Candidatus Schekmanbacteria bacterium]|nr:FG-GAP repeat protein [Candidatus Schekmanbacteria bacterium]
MSPTRTAPHFRACSRRSRLTTFAALVAALGATATTAFATSQEAFYATIAPIKPLVTSEKTYLLSDGNVNGQYTDPTTTIGYLDGPELAVFNWADKQTLNCPFLVLECATISASEGFLDTHGPTRPHWGTTSNGKDEATIYYAYRAVARNYFDAYNSIDALIADVDNEDELVVMLNRPDELDDYCGSCMRPWRSGLDMDPHYQIFRTVRPDGRNGGVPYNQRPKIFLKDGALSSLKVPIHEYGHYYNRVFAEIYGSGGGFYRHGPHEEQALDEGLGYWYSGDYANTWYMGRGGKTQENGDPRYSDWVDFILDGETEADPHYLGDVITSALWLARENSGCDKIGWRKSVLRLVDTIKGDAFGEWDAFGNGSIVRGFAHKLLDEAYSSGACAKSSATTVIEIFQHHELLPRFLDQTASQATNEEGDGFGSALAAADFNGDGFQDLAVGVPGEDLDDISDAGTVHIIYGASAGLVTLGYAPYERIDQSSIGANNVQGDAFGHTLAVADFDRDGYGDLAVGLPHKDVDRESDAGYVDIFYGSASGLNPQRYEKIKQETFGSTSESGDQFGFSLTSGDFNADSYPDLAIGAPGEDADAADDSGFLFVAYGSASGVAGAGYEKINQETFGSTSESGDRFATTLASGDFDADGYDDLAVAAPYEDIDGVDEVGFVFVAHGTSAGLHPGRYSRFGQESMGSTGESGDRFGLSLAAGDFNGDGHDDLAAGSPYEDESDAADAGFLYIVYGQSSTTLYPFSYEKLNQASGGSTAEAGDLYGFALATGDINADGIDDLAVGLPGEDTGDGDGSGYVHVYAGSSEGLTPVQVERASQAEFLGTNGDGDNFGAALALGDFDRDGKVEVAIGAPGDSLDDDGTGATYLMKP